MKNILVLCTGNSCRSQMAEGYLRHFGGDSVNIYSAGIETHGLNKMAVKIMREDAIDISGHTSNHIDEYQKIDFDFILTVCDHAKANCPYFPSKAQRFHHNFSDPSKLKGNVEDIHQAFENTRNEIKDYAKSFIKMNA